MSMKNNVLPIGTVTKPTNDQVVYHTETKDMNDIIDDNQNKKGRKSHYDIYMCEHKNLTHYAKGMCKKC